MKLYYENSLGTRIDLSGDIYQMDVETLLDYSWKYDETSYNNTNSKISRFYRNSQDKPVTITVYADSPDELLTNMENFYKVTEQDVVSNMSGVLILYLSELEQYSFECFLTDVDNEIWHKKIQFMNGKYAMNKQVTFHSPYPFWVREVFKQFLPTGREESESDFLDYPYNYPYDYLPNAGGIRTWVVDHFSASQFIMRMYGPAENPRLLVNGYPYQILDSLEQNEWFVIDSRSNTVLKRLSNGTWENAFDSRNKVNSVFEPIPSGQLTLTWSGTFGFDIRLFLERSQPRWLF